MGKWTGPCLMLAASAGWSLLGHAWTERPLLSLLWLFLSGISGYFTGSLFDRVYMASLRDDLTQAYNRRFVSRMVPGLLAGASSRKARLSISIIDCDNFKKINDEYGHEVGDSVLQGVSRLLIRNTRNEDYVIRWGGDEFLVIANGADHTDTRSMLERLENELANLSKELNFRLSVSVGTAVFPQDAARLEDLIRIADHRMYETKHARKSSTVAAG